MEIEYDQMKKVVQTEGEEKEEQERREGLGWGDSGPKWLGARRGEEEKEAVETRSDLAQEATTEDRQSVREPEENSLTKYYIILYFSTYFADNYPNP